MQSTEGYLPMDQIPAPIGSTPQTRSTQIESVPARPPSPLTKLFNRLTSAYERSKPPEVVRSPHTPLPDKLLGPLLSRRRFLQGSAGVVGGVALAAAEQKAAQAGWLDVKLPRSIPVTAENAVELKADPEKWANYQFDPDPSKPFTPEELEAMKQGYLKRPEILTYGQYNEAERIPDEYLGPRRCQRGIDKNGGKIWTDYDSGASIPVEDMIFNPPYKRSRESWEKIVNYFNVADPENIRYKARDGKTYCNIFVGDVMRAFGVPIPHWIAGGETWANKLFDMLSEGEEFPKEPMEKGKWFEVNEADIDSMAKEGIPVVFAIKKIGGGSGHLGIVSSNENGKLILAQAGATNGTEVVVDKDHYSEGNNYTKPKFFVNAQDYITYFNIPDEWQVE